MWFVVAALIIGGGAVWELTSEAAGEYLANYFIEPADLGVSSRNPETLDSGLNNGISKKVFESDGAKVLLMGVAAAGTDSSGSGSVTLVPKKPPQNARLAAAALAPPARPSEQPASKSTAAKEAKEAALRQSSTADEPVALKSEWMTFEALLGLMGDTPQRLFDGAVFLPISTQRVFGLRTVIGERIMVPTTTELPGRIVPNPSSNTLLQVRYDGTIEAANGRFPFVGRKVKRGELLAYLRPTNSHVDEARLAESIQALTNNIELSRQRMTRLEEVIYVRFRTSKIEELQVEINGLQRQKTVLEKSLNRRYELRAMTEGVVSSVGAAVGQHLT